MRLFWYHKMYWCVEKLPDTHPMEFNFFVYNSENSR